MPGVRVFVDTNVLLYLHDRKDLPKEAVAIQWLEALAKRRAARINLQVLNELTFVLLRKKWFDRPATVFSVVDTFAALGDSPVTPAVTATARRLHSATAYNWWDCLLLASALELGCTYFLSEDLQDGQVVEGLTIVDPFAHSPDQILTPR